MGGECHRPASRTSRDAARTGASPESATLPGRMPDLSSRSGPAFRALRARLLARRAEAMGTRLWIVALALAACIGAFTYWQVRVPLDGALRHGGASAATLRLGVSLALGVRSEERRVGKAGRCLE